MLQLGTESTRELTSTEPCPSRPSFDLVPGLGAHEIDRELRLADRQTDVGTRRLAFYLADMETRGVCQLLGYATATVYAVRRLEMGKRHAQQLIAAGRALEDLPRIDAAFCDGRLNWSRVRLLTRIAVRETEAAWLERALAASWAEFEREVLTSERGRPPRSGRKGLPQVKIGVAARLDRLGYEKWELAKRKLGEERGEPVTDAELMEWAAQVALATSADGTVPGRTRVDDSIYRIVVDRCSECASAHLQTAEGRAELAPAVFEAIACDAKTEVIEAVGPGRARGPASAADEGARGHPPPTPAWMRTKVLLRDGWACQVCGSRVDVQAHHVAWRSMKGATKPSNLSAFCARCHALVHENLLFVSGEAPHRLKIEDRHGRPLSRDREPIGAALRRLRGRDAITELPGGPPAPAPEVTFGSLPPRVEAGWWARHAHLFRHNSQRGELEFAAGFPIEPCREPAGGDGGGAGRHGLASLIGQQRIVESLRIAVRAARSRRAPLDHVLLLGAAGLGKTTIAKAVAHEVGARVSITSGPLIKDASVLVKALTALSEKEVLFIDEIHAIPRAVAEVLYEAMEERVLRLPVTDGHRTKTIEVALNPFTLIGATTELGRISGPLKSRFTIREHLEGQADDDLARMVAAAVNADGLGIEEGAALAIARRSHGVPRDALKLSKRIQDRAHAEQIGAIDGEFVARSLERLGIDERGLGVVERKALEALERHGRGRPMGLARWSASSGLCVAVLRQLCEPVLTSLGLMTVTPRGRLAVA
jgi:Holliday junction DNA helicase RuvB